MLGMKELTLPDITPDLPANAQATTTAQRAKRANTASIAPEKEAPVALRSAWKKSSISGFPL